MKDIIELKFIAFLLCLTFTTIFGYGQSKIYPEIGMPIPYFKFPPDKITNRVISSEDLKGKNFILDFWTTGCLACIESFPKMDSIQLAQKDNLKVILVGLADKRRDVEAFYEIYKKKFQLKLTSIIDSTVFNKFVPRGVPHLIWVDKNGIVKAITTTVDVTNRNIDKFLGGDSFTYTDVSFKTMMAAKIGYDKTKPLLIGGNGGSDTSYVFRSLISIWQQDKGTPTYLPVRPVSYGTKSRYEVIGASVQLLYTLAFYGTLNVKSEVPNAYPFPKFSDGAMKALMDRHSLEQRYNYSLELPSNVATQSGMMNKMQSDLSSYFGLAAKVSKRPVVCYDLLIIDSAKFLEIEREAGEKKISWRAENGFQRFSNVTIDEILITLTSRVLYPQFMLAYNKTGRNEKLTFDLDVDINDLGSIRNGLHELGLDLAPVKREMDVIEISEGHF